MFLHLGNDVSVRISEIIAIYDYELFRSGGNFGYIASMKQRKLFDDTGWEDEKIKSLIMTERGLYPSVISSLTLKRRADILQNGKLHFIRNAGVSLEIDNSTSLLFCQQTRSPTKTMRFRYKKSNTFLTNS